MNDFVTQTQVQHSNADIHSIRQAEPNPCNTLQQCSVNYILNSFPPVRDK